MQKRCEKPLCVGFQFEFQFAATVIIGAHIKNTTRPFKLNILRTVERDVIYWSNARIFVLHRSPHVHWILFVAPVVPRAHPLHTMQSSCFSHSRLIFNKIRKLPGNWTFFQHQIFYETTEDQSKIVVVNPCKQSHHSPMTNVNNQPQYPCTVYHQHVKEENGTDEVTCVPIQPEQYVRVWIIVDIAVRGAESCPVSLDKR